MRRSVVNPFDPKLNPQGIQIGDICRGYHEKRKTSDLIILSGLTKVRVIRFEGLNSNGTKLRVIFEIIKGKAVKKTRNSTRTTILGAEGTTHTIFVDSLIRRKSELSDGKLQEFCPFSGPYI